MHTQYAHELLREINADRKIPLYHDSSLNSYFSGIAMSNELQETPFISQEGIHDVIKEHGNELQYICDHTLKPRAINYQKYVGGGNKKLSESSQLKFKSMFSKAKQNPLLFKQIFTHCFIFLYENSYYMLMLIVLHQKHAVIDQILQKPAQLTIQGWIYVDQPMSGAQLIDGEQYYEISMNEIRVNRINVDGIFIQYFEILVDNTNTTILPIFASAYLDPPIIQLFAGVLIGVHELREQKSSNSIISKYSQNGKENIAPNISTIKSTLQGKLDQIVNQKHNGFEQEFQPKVPQTKVGQLFKIEETYNEYLQSSAKQHNTNDIDTYTADLEKRFLKFNSQPSCAIDGLIHSESQMMDKSNHSYMPLTHKDQSVSEIYNVQHLPTQDSAISEHLHSLETKYQLKSIYNELCQAPYDNSLISQQQSQLQQQNGWQQQQQHNMDSNKQYVYPSQPLESQYFSTHCPQYESGQQYDQQIQQQQLLQYQQQQQQYYYEQEQMYQQQLQQQQYLQYQMLQYQTQQQQQQQFQQQIQQQQHTQLQQQQYHDNNHQQMQSVILYQDNNDPCSPKKWSYSPQKQQESFESNRRRTSNPEPPKKTSCRYSIRQSIIKHKNQETSTSDLLTRLKNEGGKVRSNQVAFGCKLKADTLHPSDFVDLHSNRAQRKIHDIEQQFKKQSMKFVKDHNFSALYRNDKFSDISIVVNGIMIKSHKSVLLQVSQYFRTQIDDGGSELIIIENTMDMRAFDLVFRFMYMGKLPQTDWCCVDIQLGQEVYKVAELFKLIGLIEQLVARIIIPKMTIRYTLHWYLIAYRNKEIQLQHVFKFLYAYAIQYFSAHANKIIDIIRHPKELDVDEVELLEYFNWQLAQIKTEELYFLIQQPLLYADINGIDNLLWLMSQKKKCSNMELLKALANDHYNSQGFKYKDFSKHPMEQYLPAIGTQLLIYPLPTQQMKKRRSSVYTDREFQYSDNILDEYTFEYNNNEKQKISRLVYELKLTGVDRNQLIVSDCFTSQSTAWRLIIEIDQLGSVSVYIQERGLIKANLQYISMEDNYMDEYLPHYAKLHFISAMVKVEVLVDNQPTLSRQMYHTFPANQFYSVGFGDLFNSNGEIHIKVYFQEDPLHSALMSWCAYNFNESLSILPYYTLHSLFRSDMLNITDENQLAQLVIKLNDNQQNTNLIIHPIRYFYLSLNSLFTLARANQSIKQSQLFQSILNLVISYSLEEKSINQKPRKWYSKQECRTDKQHFKIELLKWLISNESTDDLKVNVDQMKKSIIDSQHQKQPDQQPIPSQLKQPLIQLTPLHYKPHYRRPPASPSNKCSIF